MRCHVFTLALLAGILGTTTPVFAQERFPNLAASYIAVYDEQGNIVGEPGCRSMTNAVDSLELGTEYIGYAELEKGKNYKIYTRITCESDQQINTGKVGTPTLFHFPSMEKVIERNWKADTTFYCDVTPVSGIGGTVISDKIYDNSNADWIYVPNTTHPSLCYTDYYYVSDFQVPDVVQDRSSIMLRVPTNFPGDIYPLDSILELRYRVISGH